VSPWPEERPAHWAPCYLNTQEGSGGSITVWPGSPCLIQEGLCLTCNALVKPSIWRRFWRWLLTPTP
jgi:hypothetical protein